MKVYMYSLPMGNVTHTGIIIAKNRKGANDLCLKEYGITATKSQLKKVKRKSIIKGQTILDDGIKPDTVKA